MASTGPRSRAELEAIARAAEAQLRRAEFLRRLAQAPTAAPETAVAQQVQPYIAISREAGVGAREVAQVLAQKTGFKIYDKELLEFMAKEYKLPVSVLGTVDETTSNWFQDTVYRWLDRKAISHEEYVHILTETILLLACAEKCVFIGRGAQFILPRERGLAVRLVAPKRYRVQFVAESSGWSAADAERWVDRTDWARNQFIRTYFHADPNDPHIYDLVVDVGRFGPEKTATLCEQAMRNLDLL